MLFIVIHRHHRWVECLSPLAAYIAPDTMKVGSQEGGFLIRSQLRAYQPCAQIIWYISYQGLTSTSV